MGRPRVKLEGTRVGRDGHIDVLRLSEHRDAWSLFYNVRCRLCGREWLARADRLRKGTSCKCIAWDTDAVRAMKERQKAKAKKQSGVLYMAVTADEYELPVAVADTPEELGAMLNRSPNTIRSLVCRGYTYEGKARHNGSNYAIRFYKVEKEEDE